MLRKHRIWRLKLLPHINYGVFFSYIIYSICIHINHSNKKGDNVLSRLRIVLEFNEKKIDDVVLYSELNKYSNAAAHIKDILRGLSPLPTLNTKDE